MDKKALVTSALKAAKKSKKPSAGMTDNEKSEAVKSAKKGTDFGKKNVPGKTGFNTVEENAEKEYGSKAVAQKVAGAAFWKMKKGK